MRSEGRRRRANRTALACAATAVLVLLVATVGICVGGQPTPVPAALSALGGIGDPTVLAIVWEVRIPRTAAAAVAGVGLGLGASLLQTLTRNPVADAGLLGSNAGATVVVAVSMAIGVGSDLFARNLAAFIGALIATSFVCVVGLSGRVHSITRLVLLGVALGAVLIGITNGVMLAAPEAFEGMRHWLAGSTVGVPLASTGAAAVTMCVALLVAIGVARTLEITRLGDESARSLGVRLGTTRVLTVLSVALASSAATALVGPITFVGLVAAHAAAGLAEGAGLSATTRHLLAAAGGAIFLVGADIIGRVALWPGELPAGIVIVVIGAPMLLWIIRRTRSLT